MDIRNYFPLAFSPSWSRSAVIMSVSSHTETLSGGAHPQELARSSCRVSCDLGSNTQSRSFQHIWSTGELRREQDDRKHAHTRSHTHTHSHTHTYAHTHTQIHIHTLQPRLVYAFYNDTRKEHTYR